MKPVTLLFIGDSITDAGRERDDPFSLGSGFVSVIASRLSASSPFSPWSVLNRGISGDRAPAVEARWSQDCLQLLPHVVTLLVGVNDTWRRFDSNVPSPIHNYERALQNMLRRLANSNNPHVILMEPFALHVGSVTSEWDEEMHSRRRVVRDLALKFGHVSVPLQDALDAAALLNEPSSLLHDGVHPTARGHELIASEWMAAFQRN
jgi:acyl-CoA thioesterase-1